MPSLLTVSGGRIDLEANRSYLLGRGANCDIVVADMASSRNHARLTVGGSGETVWIEDLESRNGTYIDEDPVTDRTRLRDGSRLRIGSTLYLLTMLDTQQSPEDFAEAGTMSLGEFSLEATMGGRGTQFRATERGSVAKFAGQLSSFGLLEVLQLLTTTRRSGTLHLELPSGRSRIEVHHGDVVDATYGQMNGFQALLLLVRQEAGIFWLAEGQRDVERTIDMPASILLVELCKALDELKQEAS